MSASPTLLSPCSLTLRNVLLDPEQLARLRAGKLKALVARQWGDVPGLEAASYGLGAALVAPCPDGAGAAAWVYPLQSDLRSLGASLVWGTRHSVSELHHVVDEAAPDADVPGVVARRAAYFSVPSVAVWAVPEAAAGASPQDLGLSEVEPAPLPSHREPEKAPELVDLLLDAGVEVLVEGGMVRGEVNGLEVARVVHGISTAGEPLDSPLLEVGVGQADRELTGMLHGDVPPADQLGRVVELVREHRRAAAPPHPLNQLVPERWLRACVVREPAMVGLEDVRVAEPPIPRPNLKDTGVAVATGITAGGDSVVLAFSVGIDTNLVPAAADARSFIDSDADLWLVVPERDAHETTPRLAAQLARPARVVTVPDAWRCP